MSNYKQYIYTINNIVANMDAQSSGMRSGVLLTGAPGVGKTSMVKFLASISGIDMVTIEAPHIVEEHIINIPFIVFSAATGKTVSGKTTGEKKGTSVVLADSHLYTRLKNARKMDDPSLLKHIYSSSKDAIGIWEEMGGNKTTMPRLIKRIRDQFDIFLFLDEFFRQTPQRIRNMLRGILDGKIGLHTLPPNVYSIFATNLEDEGIDEIPDNTQLRFVEFETPSKDSWFNYLVNSAEARYGIKFDHQLIETFSKLLSDEDMTYQDFKADVRMSPRRWEQLLHYINAALPAESQDEADQLMVNVKTNFKNYQSGKYSNLASKVLKATAELIKKTSKLKVEKDVSSTASESWRKTLSHQISIKRKIGDARAYIPVISGLPGIGKTAEVWKVAEENDMRMVYINCSNIDPEDVIGIAYGEDGEDDKAKMNVEFSMPKLYNYITNEIEKLDTEYKTALKQAGETKRLKEYDGRKWKYIIFFDELNRVPNLKVFNGLRRILLEKEFGDDMKLPAGSIIVSAINPAGYGAHKFTGHMSDVLDIIDAAATWSSTVDYLRGIKFSSSVPVPKELQNSVLVGIQNFVDTYKTDDPEIPVNQRPFHVTTGSQTLYVSPRDYTEIYTNGVLLVANIFHDQYKKAREEDRIEELKEDLSRALFDAFKSTLNKSVNVKRVKLPEFFSILRVWLDRHVNIFDGLLTKKADTRVTNFASIMDKALNDGKSDLSVSPAFTSYITNADPQVYFRELQTFLKDKISTPAEVLKYVGKDSVDKVHVVGNDLESTGEKASMFEHFIRDLLHAIKFNEMSNDFVEMTFDALTESVVELLGRDFAKEAESLSDEDKAAYKAIEDRALQINTTLYAYRDEF